MDLVGQCGKKTVPRLSRDLWHEQCILEGSSKASSSADTDWMTKAHYTEPHQGLEEIKPLDLLDSLVLLAFSDVMQYNHFSLYRASNLGSFTFQKSFI